MTAAASKPRIGLIGVGLMGLGIATNLARKATLTADDGSHQGHTLAILDHPGNQPTDSLRALGVQVFTDIPALTANSDVIVLCVNGSDQVDAIMLGEGAGAPGDERSGGVLAALRPGMVVIDCSTAIPARTVAVASQVLQRGAQFLDAPMTRTPNEAMQGRLNLLVGGDAAVLQACRPILGCFAENIVHVGPIGTGHRMKLLHNFVSIGSLTLMAEAAAAAQCSGMDLAIFADVLGKGGGWGAALERLKPYLLQQDTSGMRFSLANANKDLAYYQAMADELGAADAVASGVASTLAGVCAQGHAARLLPELVSLLAQVQQDGSLAASGCVSTPASTSTPASQGSGHAL